jgi:hypothetical protein
MVDSARRAPTNWKKAEMGPNGHLLIGDHGKILASGGGRGNFRLIPEARGKEHGDRRRSWSASIGHYKNGLKPAKVENLAAQISIGPVR